MRADLWAWGSPQNHKKGDLIDFTDRLTQAERAEVDALANYNIEIARWRFASGTLLEARNVQLERDEPEQRPWWAMF